MTNLPRRLTRLATLGVASLVAFSTAARPLFAQTLTLSDAIDFALSSHPTLRGENARTLQAEEAASAARGTRWPTVGFDVSLTHFQDPMLAKPIHSFDPAGVPSFGETILLGKLGLRYTVLGGGRSSRIEGTLAGVSAARAQGRVAELQLIESVAEAYLGVLASRALQDAATARVTALTAEETRARRRFDAGSAPAIEILRATAALQEARAQETEATSGVALAERGLGRLIGAPTTAVAGTAIADITFATEPEAGSSSASPRIVRAERVADATRAVAAERRADLFPKVDLTAGLIDFATPTGPHIFEWQVGVQLSWAVFNGGVRGASIRGAEAAVEAAQSDLASMRLRVDQEADAARTAVETSEARAAALAISVTQWEELTRIEALALEAGSGVQSDLLRAEASLFQAQAGHVRARYQAMIARVRLARAQGVLSKAWIDEALETS